MVGFFPNGLLQVWGDYDRGPGKYPPGFTQLGKRPRGPQSCFPAFNCSLNVFACCAMASIVISGSPSRRHCV